MECGRFILSGSDKKTLSNIKNTLVTDGHVFIGYAKDAMSILRHVQSHQPDFILVDIASQLNQYKPNIEIMDEETLTACILVLEKRNDEVIEFLQKKKVVSYLTKPVNTEALLQVVDLSLLNLKRVIEYEQKVRKLNETLESRKLVEKAKWILIEEDGFTEAGAYEAIKKKSRDNRIPMKDIAQAIILTRG